jgi:hypothetical protein
MPSFSNLDDRRSGKSLTVKPIQTTQRVRPRDCATFFPLLCRLLALLLALAVAPTVTFAGETAHDQGHVNDPTGAWLIRNGEGLFILMTFHAGGTLTGDFQGEAAFVPGGQPPFDVIVTPQSGVWQKTGAKRFAATFLALEYQAATTTNPPSAPLFQIDKVQLTGVLNESGDQMQLTALTTVFNPDGSQKGNSFPDTANGIRIPLEILPNTSHSLPIPIMPPL